MRKILPFTLITLCVNNAISQQQNMATIVTDTKDINMHIIYKVLIMLFLGVVALVSYLQYRKTEH